MDWIRITQRPGFVGGAEAGAGFGAGGSKA